MNLDRVLLTIAMVLVLSGCTRMREGAMSLPDKANAAFPVTAEVEAAQLRLKRLMKDAPEALEQVQEQLDTRLERRGLRCIEGLDIGRFADLNEVRRVVPDRSCFLEQDAALIQFYGIRTIGLLLAQPPLRPLKPVGPIQVMAHQNVYKLDSGAIAREAGVAYVQGPYGNGAILEIPGSKSIAELQKTKDVVRQDLRLSPNGRVFVAREGKRSVFYAAQTGQVIWESAPDAGLLEWLPHLNSLLMTTSEGGVVVIDGDLGISIDEPLAPQNSRYATTIPGRPARTLVGTNNRMVLLEHSRAGVGISTTNASAFEIPGYGITSGRPVSMRGGRLVVFVSLRDMAWLDLESGKSGIWKTSPFFHPPFAKLSEARLMLDAIGTRGFPQPWVLDIETMKVAPADLGARPGVLLDIGDRVGFLRREHSIAYGDEAEAGASEFLDKVVAAAELEQQLAKLQEMSALAHAPTRPGWSEAMAGPDAARPTSTVTLPPAAITPGLDGLPKNAQVHIVGVYEAKQLPNTAPAAPRPPVRVVVRGSPQPVVLVLAAHVAVNWQVSNVGAQIAAVLIAGDAASNVTGVGSVPVLRIGHHSAYTNEGSDYQRFRLAVERYTGPAPIRSFQGAYQGSEFSVGGF